MLNGNYCVDILIGSYMLFICCLSTWFLKILYKLIFMLLS